MVLYMAHEHAKYIGKNGVLYIWCFPWRIYAASWQQQAGYAASDSFGWLLIDLSWPAWATFGLSWVQLVAVRRQLRASEGHIWSCTWLINMPKYIGKNGVRYIWLLPWPIYASSWPQQAGYAASISLGRILIDLRWPAWANLGLSWVQLVAIRRNLRASEGHRGAMFIHLRPSSNSLRP